MTSAQSKSQVKRPETLDLEKARVVAAQVIKENKEWLKEMANK